MIEAASDLRRGLPIVVNPVADEVLSSWLTRIAQDYFVAPRSLLTHMGLSVPSVQRLDVSLTFGQAIAISGFVHRPPDEPIPKPSSATATIILRSLNARGPSTRTR